MNELSLVLKATVILAAALAAVRCTRRAPAALRALMLACSIGVLLAMPFVSLVIEPKTLTLPILPGSEPRVIQVGMVDITPGPDTGRPGPLAAADLARASFLSPITVLRLVWLIGSLFVAIRVGWALMHVSRIRRAGRPWPDDAMSLREMLPDRSSWRTVRVFLHQGLAAPMTCGLLRPVIGLPADTPDWPVADVRRALIHEMQHVRRADWLVQLLAELACALYWFHPLAWIVSRRLRLECEHACDDAVVRVTGGPEYAQQLVALARRLSARRIATPRLSMADGSSLSERIRTVLDSEHPRHEIRFASAALTVGVAVVLSLTLATARIVAQTSPRGGDSLSIPTSLGVRGFETVSIRPSDSRDRAGFEFDAAEGRLSLRRVTLGSLIVNAYSPIAASAGSERALLELPEARLKGGPDWMNVDEFTIEATTSLPASMEELNAMMRRLLQEHFNLAVHLEMESTPAYRLVRAGSGALGPGLKPVENCFGPVVGSAGLGELKLRCATLAMAASSIHLSEVLGRPVVDRTDVKGAFDLSLVYAPTRDELVTIYDLDPDDLPKELAPLALRPSIFDAVQTQLGLRLEPTQATVDTLAIDWADRPTRAR